MEKPLPGEEPMFKALAADLHEETEELPRTGKPWSEMSAEERRPFESAARRLVTDCMGHVLGATLEEHDARA